MLVEARGNSAVMLDAVEEPLDAIAMLVDARTEGRRVGAMIERSDVGERAGNFIFDNYADKDVQKSIAVQLGYAMSAARSCRRTRI